MTKRLRHHKLNSKNPSMWILRLYSNMQLEYKNIDAKEHLTNLGAAGISQAMFKQRIRLYLHPLSTLKAWQGVLLVRMRTTSHLMVVVDSPSIQEHGFSYTFEYESSRRRRDDTIRYSNLNAEQFIYLIQNGYDVFGLIPQKLAYKAKPIKD